MKKNYNIIWLLYSSFDVKVDISTSIEMLRELENKGNDVMLVTSFREKKIKVDIKTIYLKMINKSLFSRIQFNLKCYAFLSKEIHKLRNNTIIIADQNSIYGAILFKIICKLVKKGKVKVHFDIRTVPVELIGIKGYIIRAVIWKTAIKIANYFADSFSFITKEIEEIAQYKNKKTCIWSSGVNLKKFAPKNDLKTTKKENIVFYHGVTTPMRGLRETIKAIEIIKEIIDNIKLVIVGDGSDLNYLKEMVEKKALNNYVKFTGKVDYKNIEKYIEMAKVCICPLPSILEWNVSSPLKVLEYTAMGKPCILTEIKAHTKLFDKDTEGIHWAGEGTPNEIAKSILNVFNNRNQKYYYKNLRKIAEDNSWQIKAQTLNNYWNTIYK